MRVLAIRGRNLASLMGKFEVDFTTEPLASAGLFAITGPTGSGKSTLLDALCLALYGETPRLEKAHRGDVPDVGEEMVSQGDPRTVLSRGTGEGFAEVDFIGVDGIGYRANWSVRRARSKSTAKLQKVEMTLRRIADGVDVGSRLITEVKESIREKVGLRFEQFTRAVLLAQNEFAAFLKADDNDRAELLEMLTGTERFTVISRRAHERAVTERRNLELIRARQSEHLPMDEGARAELDAAYAQAMEGVRAVQRRVASLEAGLRWHEAWRKVTADEQQAFDVVQAAARSRQDASGRRARLQHVEAVQAARPLLEKCQRLAAEADALTHRDSEARAAVVRSEEAIRVAQDSLAKAQIVQDAAESARRAAAPALDQAKVLTAKLLEREPERHASQKAVEQLATDLAEARRALLIHQTEINKVEGELHELTEWLKAHASLELLSGQWPRWESLLARAAPMTAELSHVRKALPALTDDDARHGRAFRTATNAIQSLETAVSQSVQTLAGETAALSAWNGDGLLRTRRDLETRRDALHEATTVCNSRRELEQQAVALRGRIDTDARARAQNLLALEQARGALPEARAREQAVATALRDAEITVSERVEHLRSELQPGKPCPVCGATEHPSEGQSTALKAVLNGLSTQARDARKALEVIITALNHAEATAREQAKGEAERKRELAGLVDRIDECRRQWGELPVATEAPKDPDDHGEWLASQTTVNRESIVALSAQEQQMQAALTRRDSAQAQLDQARERLSVDRAQLDEMSRKAHLSGQALASAVSREADLKAGLQALLDELDAAFPDAAWREPWRVDPGRFQQWAGEQARTWRQKLDRRNRLAEQLRDSQTRAGILSGQAEEASRREEAARTQLRSLDERIGQSRLELRQLLGDASVEVFERSLDEAVATALAASSRCRGALEREGLSRAKAQEAARQAGEQRESVARHLVDARAALLKWIETFQSADTAHPALDPPMLEGLLAQPQEWIKSERQQLTDLELAESRALAVLEDRRKSRHAHEAISNVRESDEDLQESLKLAHLESREAESRRSMLGIKRGQDDERRRAAQTIGQELQDQSARTHIWEQVDELIGSSDGRKFRNIAQQMTLDVLLGYANQHLASLARRYRLQRTSDKLGLMVVDQNMGDEVRSVLSLSGGESFLVSLALALALASLSSHRIRVESLFIDEGFGSLDADALNVALEALDGLQAQGRKVGVISHVQEMTERIGTQIRVERMAGGRSRVVCEG